MKKEKQLHDKNKALEKQIKTLEKFDVVLEYIMVKSEIEVFKDYLTVNDDFNTKKVLLMRIETLENGLHQLLKNKIVRLYDDLITILLESKSLLKENRNELGNHIYLASSEANHDKKKTR